MPTTTAAAFRVLPEPFHLDVAAGGLLSRLRGPVESLFGFPELNDVYAGAAPSPRFCERALELLGVAAQVSEADLARIPASGPLIVVANHPFGGIDGLLLLALLQRVRADVKVLANRMLSRIPELQPNSLFVDAFGGPGAATSNATALRAAVKWVCDGGVLGAFPAGEVAHFDVKRRVITDPPWNNIVGRLALKTGATVLPVFFAGHNSLLFQAAGVVHPRLRTALLPRELLRMRGRRVRVRIGTPIAPAKLARLGSGREVTSYLRLRTYLLNASGQGLKRPTCPPPAGARDAIIAPTPANVLAAEVASLPANREIERSGSLAVLYANAAEIPNVLREIGRLREITFRGVGEGTGKPLDLDRFDDQYRHLFVWNGELREVVGAYRMGATDEIVPRLGLDGLYTHTLFRYRQALLDQIGPALELGRSFVRPEYQREYAPLLLLWRGIGGYVARHPQYRMLFGPVCISNEYDSVTKHLLVSFLRVNRALPNLGRLVRPRNEPRFTDPRECEVRSAGSVVRNIAEVDELVAEIEAGSGRRGVPVLLRQYLKLNARLLGFNVDPAFGHALDALMLVDLADVERPVLARYMGREAAEAFLARHKTARSKSTSDRVNHSP